MSSKAGNGGSSKERDDERWTLVTGGAGFVGSNLVDRLAREGRRVRILDNLSRPGVERNAEWLRQRHDGKVDLVRADVRDRSAVKEALRDVGTVFHFAAQVAVTTSLDDPTEDFQVNLEGTFGLLEAIRRRPRPPRLFFTSTNKVYGSLPDVEMMKLSPGASRYSPAQEEIRRHGISEARPLDFHSPYGCSKGGADQYVLDYSRTLGLETVVFRMSCIYGPRQFGTEDQGWIAHFLLRALAGESITLYGDGRQVRDVLFVEDLVEAFLAAERQLPAVSGMAFNVGGGPENTLSLLELLDLISELTGRRPAVDFASWRAGDQRYYVSDTRRLQSLTGWRPQVGVKLGVRQLLQWLRQLSEPAEIAAPLPAPAADRRRPEIVAQELGALG
ncbi:MAG TPA: SDR family NAD(P)-dependent oxidoreductase [Thermoanaerobaculia bacterium]|nr:SDR family NAD(P)-dependent oxidoreductase [Thermoanaerobaculia bacterium]